MLLTKLRPNGAKIPKRAIVLCAGRGERLRPITDKTPKPLIELGGMTVLDRTLEHLGAVGVEKVVVNHWHLGDQIVDHLSKRTGLEIAFSAEQDLLETGGGVKNALAELGDEPFFVINGDAVWLDGMADTLARFAAAWNGEEMDIQLLLYSFARVLGWHGYGDFEMDPLGRVSWREEGRVAPYAYIGVSIVHPKVFEDTPDGPFSMRLPYTRSADAGRLFGQIHDGLWYHISTPEDLEAARRRFANGHVPEVPFF